MANVVVDVQHDPTGMPIAQVALTGMQQTFTAGTSGTIDSVDVFVNRTGIISPSGTFFVRLHNQTASGTPGSFLGAPVFMNILDIPVTNSFVTIDFSSQNLNVMPGDGLSIELGASSGSALPRWLATYQTDAFPQGSAYASFGQFAPYDFGFRFRVDQAGNPIGGPRNAQVDLDVVDILDPGTETTDLGGLHRLDAQSFGGAGLVEKSNQLSRAFTFDADGTDPVTVYLHGLLDGFMEADLGGFAEVLAELEIFDFTGDVKGASLGYTNFNQEAASTAINEVEITLFETLGLEVDLVPGGRYLIESTLNLVADQRTISGAARALFANTFEYAISGTSTNPFDDPNQMTQIITTSTVPEPATGLLFVIGIGLLETVRRRRREN